ncbi:MAG: hypothetical protein K0Q55_1733 [Verrucomicrobia bacterium]|nr:hypothetical protein [Verrucomicrobiota bacterium]
MNETQRRICAFALDLHHVLRTAPRLQTLQMLRKLFHRRLQEYLRHREPCSKSLFQLCHQFHRQQRMAAHLKEIVLDAHGMDAQHVFPHLDHLAFRLVSRLQQPLRHTRSVNVGSEWWQESPVHLAIGIQGKFCEPVEDGRHHVIGQAAPQESP